MVAGVGEQVDGGAVGRGGEPGQYVRDRATVGRGGEEEGAQGVARRGRPEVAPAGLVDAGGDEVPGEPLGAGEVAGVGEDVPPHLARVMGDLLRVKGPDGAHLRPRVDRGGVGVVGRLVRGEQNRTGSGEYRRDRQPGRLTGARRHDGDDDVLPGGADLGLAGRERADQDAPVVGRDLFYTPGRSGSGAGCGPSQ